MFPESIQREAWPEWVKTTILKLCPNFAIENQEQQTMF